MSFSSKPIPRVAAIHDLSGVGRCALTAVIPTMSALGIQVCPVPTAVLSTQTDGFEHFTFRDLTGEVLPIFEHWAQLGLAMDGIFTGFLGSVDQVDIVRGILERAGEGCLKVVDPVMGDDGLLYPTITPEMGAHMRRLCAVADLVIPNLTECNHLIGRSYTGGLLAEQELRRCLKELCELGAKTAVITGVPLKEGWLTNAAYDSATGRFVQVDCEKLAQSYPGTGDTFASVLSGLLLQGAPLERALQGATDYLSATIALTIEMGTPQREGIAMERTLPLLMQLAQDD